ncbi:hypothetical protein E4T66_20475 [Sinimarinibacterium sp. CAU 1509]|uniref:hypothetical protein n=1 Tax=Sinimarinibacterium sp. CAU 1509 TaxID=2562283 RepID=UPI0010AB9D8B|nr:hypothetical protein [Sinimarinibacterium sp. CAU 1509]TJY55759.1 hypothetical protein E4T66_20475 [Sinimarinibacterium sp. CAU 1509]
MSEYQFKAARLETMRELVQAYRDMGDDDSADEIEDEIAEIEAELEAEFGDCDGDDDEGL